jgi:hypothetical protein
VNPCAFPSFLLNGVKLFEGFRLSSQSLFCIFNNLGYDKNAGDKYLHPNILQLKENPNLYYAMLTHLHEIEKKAT